MVTYIMKTNIAKINSIYKPQRKRKYTKRVEAKLVNGKSSLRQAPSMRSLSVSKSKEQSFLRNFNHSVEPHLPVLKSRSPEPLPPNSLNISTNSSISYEADLQRLEKLISRNQSARNGLLQVQARIMEIGVSHAIRKNLEKIDEESRRDLKLPPLKT